MLFTQPAEGTPARLRRNLLAVLKLFGLRGSRALTAARLCRKDAVRWKPRAGQGGGTVSPSGHRETPPLVGPPLQLRDPQHRSQRTHLAPVPAQCILRKAKENRRSGPQPWSPCIIYLPYIGWTANSPCVARGDLASCRHILGASQKGHAPSGTSPILPRAGLAPRRAPGGSGTGVT